MQKVMHEHQYRAKLLAQLENELKHDVEVALDAWASEMPGIVRSKMSHIQETLDKLANELEERTMGELGAR